MSALKEMRRVSKEKELEALLSAENDQCSCYIEVTKQTLEFSPSLKILLKRLYLFE